MSVNSPIWFGFPPLYLQRRNSYNTCTHFPKTMAKPDEQLNKMLVLKEMTDTDASTSHRPPPLPTPEQIISLAASTGLAHEDSYGDVYSPYAEDTDIRDIVVDFAIKLLYTYGNLP